MLFQRIDISDTGRLKCIPPTMRRLGQQHHLDCLVERTTLPVTLTVCSLNSVKGWISDEDVK